jgi:DNA processing protein
MSMPPCLLKDDDDAVYLATLVMGYMPSAKVLHKLLMAAGCAKALWQQWHPDFLHTVLPPATVKTLLAKSTQWQHPPEAVAHMLRQTHTQIVDWANMPPGLKAMADPPACLFAKGHVPLLQHTPALGVVGTRKATEVSHTLIPQLIAGLVPYAPVIISGLAEGVDGLAHKAALANQLPTVAVLGTGLQHIYPAQHTGLVRDIVTTGGLVLTEYPPAFPGDRFTFPARNRIITGLSQGVLITECPMKSGAMITARFAADHGREVLAIPGSPLVPNAAGPNYWLAHGAALVQTPEDIIAAMGWQPTAVSKQLPLLTPLPLPNGVITPPPIATHPMSAGLPPHLQRVLQAIPWQPIALEDVLNQLAAAPVDTAGVNPPPRACLSLLELEGHIEMLPGQLVVRR